MGTMLSVLTRSPWCLSAVTLLLRPGFLEIPEDPLLWGLQTAGMNTAGRRGLKKVKHPFTKGSRMLFYNITALLEKNV